MEKQIALFFWDLKDALIHDIFAVFSAKGYIAVSSAVFAGIAIRHLKKRFFLFAAAALLAVAASDLLCYRVLKPAIGRSRPKVELGVSVGPVKADDFSMPSNHASNAFAFFTVYLFFAKKFWPALLASSLMIAASRVVLVKHYPTDVIAGIGVGTAIGVVAVLTVLCAERLIQKQRLKESPGTQRLEG